MKNWWAPKQTGFTIVELLIVIVVIAILAAITIVAFNGMRTRAIVASVEADTNKFVKAVELANVDGGYPATVGAQASELSQMKLSDKNQVAKYTTNGQSFRVCIIAVEGETVLAYSIYDSGTSGITQSGAGEGPTSDCTPPAPAPPEFVNGIRCPVITFGTPFAHPSDATKYRVRVDYTDSTISRIDGIGGSPVDGSGGQYVYIDQGALDRYDFPRSQGVSWSNTPISVRGSSGGHRYDCTITWSWPAD
jgi:prepilin-type N-terminal cleavage/methylation domain-containing protein